MSKRKKERKKEMKKKLANYQIINVGDIIQESMIPFMASSIYRMLPNVIDGLKPVQRKILFSMYKNNVFTYTKNSITTGDVSKYLTTGDDSVYPALVKMGQVFRNEFRPISIHGNQGYIISDKEPAAKRYTESKLNDFAKDFYFDEDFKNTIFIDNYNMTLQEPLVIPTVLPMVLIQGTKGTASGYTNSILPHDLFAIADCYIKFIEFMEGSLKIEKLNSFIEKNIKLGIPNKIKVLNSDGIYKGLIQGKGKVILEGKMKVTDASYGRKAIVISELPYELCVNDFIDSLKGNKALELFSELNDYSDRGGILIELILKKGVSIKLAQEYIYLKTKFRNSYNYTGHCTLVGTEDERIVKRCGILDIFQFHYIFKRNTTLAFLKDKKESLLISRDNLEAAKKILCVEKNKKKFFNIIENNIKSKVVSLLMKEFKIKEHSANYVLDRKMWNLVHKAEDIEKELKRINNELEIVEKGLRNVNQYMVNKIKTRIKKYKTGGFKDE